MFNFDLSPQRLTLAPGRGPHVFTRAATHPDFP